MPHKNNKKLFIAAGIVSVFALGFAIFPGGKTRAQSDLVSTEVAGLTAPVVAATTGRDILVLLEDLKKIALNSTIFTDPAFLSLKDFRVTLPEQEKKRANPFAPIGKDVDLGTMDVSSDGTVPTENAPAPILPSTPTQPSANNSSVILQNIGR